MKQTFRGAWHSLTMWFNCLLLSMLPLFEMLADAVPQLREFLPDNVYKTMGLVAVLGNILLRFKTRQPLNEK